MPTPNQNANLIGAALITAETHNPTPASKFFDTAASLDSVVNLPSRVQVNVTEAATTAEVWVKIHKDAPWSVLWTSNGGIDSYVNTFLIPYPFVKVVRTAGAGAVVAFQTHG